ncbi:protein of unknown function UPF0099 [Staphylothermus marinus F1]|uniref:Peptidyl-tRNA hydrolase n=2 Tax=Staphylothermus marinus TaxID=2280 RepID=PTH_STAMF|nr:peptidyl-tRNA hydrolase Pth2 [Staphylothermus marinus]A3DMF7.1 RecName: Full=Peptidyl-tRNA hydrolase; Short=PTH [Staphylothermus marinus F1]ABN69817.1 protein of unknown function UPF0099 [Staphylothermus marinus F1]
MLRNTEYKQVIIVRTDIKMSKGKLAVQVAHAAVSAAFEAYKKKREWFLEWWATGQKKIVVKGGSERDLLKYAEMAKKKDLPVAIIRDAGLTELPPNTLTAVGIGPGPSRKIDEITGDLKLL